MYESESLNRYVHQDDVIRFNTKHIHETTARYLDHHRKSFSSQFKTSTPPTLLVHGTQWDD